MGKIFAHFTLIGSCGFFVESSCSPFLYLMADFLKVSLYRNLGLCGGFGSPENLEGSFLNSLSALKYDLRLIIKLW